MQCLIFSSIQEGKQEQSMCIHNSCCWVIWATLLCGIALVVVVLVRQDHACGWLIERKGWPAGCQIQEASVLRHAINIPVVFQYIAK